MWYRINSPHIAYEAHDGEVFIINAQNGIYYVASGYAAIIWNAIAANYSLSSLQRAFASAEIFAENNQALAEFIADLLKEELISTTETVLQEPSDKLTIEKNISFHEPVLTKYTDLQEVVMLDPIHDVSISQGWPFQK